MARGARPGSGAPHTALLVLRRAGVAFGVAAVVSAVVRLVPHGLTPERHGGWRELPPAELEEPPSA